MKKVAPYAPESLALYDRNMQYDAKRFAAKKRGAFEAHTCSLVTKLATKHEPCGNHCPPHVFLGAVSGSFFLFLRSFLYDSVLCREYCELSNLTKFSNRSLVLCCDSTKSFLPILFVRLVIRSV